MIATVLMVTTTQQLPHVVNVITIVITALPIPISAQIVESQLLLKGCYQVMFAVAKTNIMMMVQTLTAQLVMFNVKSARLSLSALIAG